MGFKNLIKLLTIAFLLVNTCGFAAHHSKRHVILNFEENDHYQLFLKGKLLGKGCFKEVYEIIDHHSKLPDLKKVYLKPRLNVNEKVKVDLKRELIIQAFLADQNVSNSDLFYSLDKLKAPQKVICPHVYAIALFESNSSSQFNFAIVERLQMTLEDWLKKNHQGAVDALDIALKYCEEFVEQLLVLHETGLCHGDFHVKNIGIDNFGNLKLLDFGAANLGIPELRDEEDLPLDRGWNENHAAYFSPEVRSSINSSGNSSGWMTRTSFESDVYSCAYAICEMIIGEAYFSEIEVIKDPNLVPLNPMQFVFSDEESTEEKLKSKISSNLIHFLNLAFSTNKHERPTLNTLKTFLIQERTKKI